MTAFPFFTQLLLALIVVTAAVYDVRYRRIPNWLTLSGILLGFGLNALLGGFGGVALAGKGMLLAFAVYFVLYLLHAVGAGDAKLMAAAGAVAGPDNWFVVFIFTALCGGIFALILLLSRRRFKKTIWNVGYLLYEIAHFRAPYLAHEELDVKNPKALRLPHGLTIAVGTGVFLVVRRLLAN